MVHFFTLLFLLLYSLTAVWSLSAQSVIITTFIKSFVRMGPQIFTMDGHRELNHLSSTSSIYTTRFFCVPLYSRRAAEISDPEAEQSLAVWILQVSQQTFVQFIFNWLVFINWVCLFESLTISSYLILFSSPYLNSATDIVNVSVSQDNAMTQLFHTFSTIVLWSLDLELNNASATKTERMI